MTDLTAQCKVVFIGTVRNKAHNLEMVMGGLAGYIVIGPDGRTLESVNSEEGTCEWRSGGVASGWVFEQRKLDEIRGLGVLPPGTKAVSATEDSGSGQTSLTGEPFQLI